MPHDSPKTDSSCGLWQLTPPHFLDSTQIQRHFIFIFCVQRRTSLANSSGTNIDDLTEQFHLSLRRRRKGVRRPVESKYTNYFEVLEVRPAIGRGFAEVEGSSAGGAPVAVISYALWKSRYKGEDTVLGKTISLNKHAFTIIGVAPREFQGSYTALRCDIWVPLVMDGQLVPGGSRLEVRDNTWVNALGRLQPGVHREQAQTELDAEFQQLV